jgi:hypothetical protein
MSQIVQFVNKSIMSYLAKRLGLELKNIDIAYSIAIKRRRGKTEKQFLLTNQRSRHY